jgi:hypothetical protein
MSLRQWLLAGAIAVVGCAHATAGVPDSAVARLPVEDRAQIATAQKSVDVAESNLGSAKEARDDAKQFHKIAMSDLDAAKSKLDAARAGLDLGRSTRDDRALREASRSEDIARNQVIAARAKLDYADRLLELREAKVDEGDAEIAAARADVEATKLHLLEQRDLAGDVNARGVQARRQDAQEKLAEKRARVAQLEGDVAQLKTAWDDRRHESDVAARDVRGTTGSGAPDEVPMPSMRWRDPPHGDVNDTPAAPETKQSQQPRNNIAPAP